MRCPRCNYEAGNETICPKCGMPLIPFSNEPTTIIAPQKTGMSTKRMERFEKYLIAIMILLFGIFLLEVIQTGILLF
ncbi:MAG: hypothetical protein Q4C20_01565 [Erysipelotrichaceae bacterium]|nr:hypothetical protein [Erysipelotrichaceae bacterium]